MKQTLKVEGIHCTSCEAILKDSFGELPGINTVKISAANGQVAIDFDEKKVTLATIKNVILKEGYRVV